MTRFVRIDTRSSPTVTPSVPAFLGTIEQIENGRVRLTGRFVMETDHGKVVKEHIEVYETSIDSFDSIIVKDLTEKEYFLELLKWEI